MPSKGPALKKPLKRYNEVVRSGALIMRQKGALSMRLQDLADHLGVAYTALYHYFPSRDHLVEAVLLWLMEQRRAHFDEAEGASALERMLDFVYRCLTEDLEHKARFPFLGGFPEPHRKSIERLRGSLVRSIVELLESGMAEGSIRECHALTIANVTMDYLDRFVGQDDGLLGEVKPRDIPATAASVIDILRFGLLHRGVLLGRPSFDLPSGEDLVGTPRGLAEEFDRYEDVLRASTAAFNAHGAGASIPRIAAELGVSKTVIYQYAVDKQDLLAQCYLRGTRVIEASQRTAHHFGRDPLDELLIHRNNVYKFHSSTAGPFTLLNAVDYLRPQQARVIRVRNRANRATSEDRLARAIRAGLVREDINPHVTQPLIGQALYGLPAWFYAGYPITVMDIAYESLALVLKGLAAEPAASSRAAI